MSEPGEITRLLRAHRDGDRGAFDELVGLAHEELRRLARRQLQRAPRGATLDTVGLVNDTYLRLVEQSDVEWQDRGHFFAVITRAMRFIVVDHARRRSARKRGGDQVALTLDPELVGVEEQAEAVLAVDAALERLAQVNERLAQVVESRFFAGLSDDEIAAALGVSSRTVQRDWIRARAWLQRALRAVPEDP